MKWKNKLCSLSLILLLISCAHQLGKVGDYNYKVMDKDTRKAHKRVEKFLIECKKTGIPVKPHRATRIDSVIINEEEKQLDI